MEIGLHPEVEVGDHPTEERPLDLEDENDVVAKATTAKVFNDVLAGGTAVRKWKSAWNGRKTTTGPQGRPDVNHANLALSAMNHLLTVFNAQAWHDILAVRRVEIVKKWDLVLEKMPDELRVRIPKVGAK